MATQEPYGNRTQSELSRTGIESNAQAQFICAVSAEADVVQSDNLYKKSKLICSNGKFLPNLSAYPVDYLTYADVMQMARKCFGHLKLSSRQRYLGYLKALFNYGTKHKITANNPLETWEKQSEPRLEYNLTLSILEKLVSHAAHT